MDLREKSATVPQQAPAAEAYEAPTVLRVSLRPSEAVLGHCKVAGSAGRGSPCRAPRRGPAPGGGSQETIMSSAATHFAGSTKPRQQARRGLESQLAYRIAGISFGMNNHDGLRMILDASMQPFAVQKDVCDVELQIALVDA